MVLKNGVLKLSTLPSQSHTFAAILKRFMQYKPLLRNITRISRLFALHFFFGLVCTKASAQQSQAYPPSVLDTVSKAATIKTLDATYARIEANLPTEYTKQYRAFYSKLKESRKDEISYDYYCQDKAVNAYLRAILAEVKLKNPSIQTSDVQLLASRSSVPNAVTHPDGYIVFHLGLISAMENESQIAAVMCHELAHHQLHHSHRSLKKYFDAFYSKEGQRKIKEIVNSDVDSYTKAEKYLEEMVFSRNRHSRDHEAEADSLALIWLRNTAYDATQMPSMLGILDHLDSIRYAAQFDLSKVFGFETYPFKKSWLAEEETMFSKAKSMSEQYAENASLKTHPECALRARTALAALGGYTAKNKANLQGDELFEKMRTYAQFETIWANAEVRNADKSLFEALNLLQTYPQHTWLHGMVGHNLNTMYAALKKHKLTEEVILPRRDLPTGYQPFIRFLNNISLTESAQLSYRYLERLGDEMAQKDAFLLYNRIVAANNCQRTAEVKRLREMYRTHHPKGEHRDALKELFSKE